MSFDSQPLSLGDNPGHRREGAATIRTSKVRAQDQTTATVATPGQGRGSRHCRLPHRGGHPRCLTRMSVQAASGASETAPLRASPGRRPGCWQQRRRIAAPDPDRRLRWVQERVQRSAFGRARKQPPYARDRVGDPRMADQIARSNGFRGFGRLDGGQAYGAFQIQQVFANLRWTERLRRGGGPDREDSAG
jgi:hypothetical protein